MHPISTHQPSPADLERFRSRVRSEWTDSVTVEAWQRWHPRLTASFRRMTDALLDAADIRPGQRVLDLACGTGDPALTIAERVGPTGHVVATDLAPGMVAAARENARSAGLGNLSFRPADAEALPFADEEFERVTCRLGAMFWPDVVRAQREILRVLRPGGRVAELVWGAPEQQEFFQCTLGVVMRHVQVPPPEPGAPSVFRFAEPGALSATLRAAGFREVSEDRHVLDTVWPGTPEELWQSFREMAAPFRALIQGLGPAVRARVDAEVLDELRRREAKGRIPLRAEVVVGTGVR